MEPTTATMPTADLTLSSNAGATAQQSPLPRPVVNTVLLFALLSPVILLVTLILVMVATQYNFLNWME